MCHFAHTQQIVDVEGVKFDLTDVCYTIKRDRSKKVNLYIRNPSSGNTTVLNLSDLAAKCYGDYFPPSIRRGSGRIVLRAEDVELDLTGVHRPNDADAIYVHHLVCHRHEPSGNVAGRSRYQNWR